MSARKGFMGRIVLENVTVRMVENVRLRRENVNVKLDGKVKSVGKEFVNMKKFSDPDVHLSAPVIKTTQSCAIHGWETVFAKMDSLELIVTVHVQFTLGVQGVNMCVLVKMMHIVIQSLESVTVPLAGKVTLAQKHVQLENMEKTAIKNAPVKMKENVIQKQVNAHVKLVGQEQHVTHPVLQESLVRPAEKIVNVRTVELVIM